MIRPSSKKFCIALLVLLSGPAVRSYSYKQSKSEGGLPGEYMSFFSVNARAQALGGAYSAIASEASDIYYNPAAAAGRGKQQVEAMYTPLVGGGNYTAIYYSNGISLDTSFGAGIVAYGSGEAVKRNSWGEETGTFKENNTCFTLNASKLFNNVAGGINLKFVRQEMDSFADSSVGLDAGITFSAVRSFGFAFVLQNMLSPSITLINTEDRYPINIKMGLFFTALRGRIKNSADISFWDPRGQSSIRWAFGTEYPLFDILKVRAGVNYKNITAGLGINADKIDFSYALRYSALGINHSVSTSYRFGYLASARERDIAEAEVLLWHMEKEFTEINRKKEKALKEKMKKSYEQIEKEENDIKEREKELDSLVNAAAGIKLGNYKEAEEILNKILSRNPENKNASSMLNMIQDELDSKFSFSKMMKSYDEEDYVKALKESKKAKPSDSNYKQAVIIGLLSEARVKVLDGDYDSANAKLKELQKIDPENSIAKTLLERIDRLQKLDEE